MARALLCALLALAPFASAVGDVVTRVHWSGALAGNLSISLADSFGFAITREQLAVHHSRRLHVYALHAVRPEFLGTRPACTPARPSRTAAAAVLAAGRRADCTAAPGGSCCCLTLAPLQDLNLVQHLHPEDYEQAGNAPGLFAAPLTLPQPGTWYVNVAYLLRPATGSGLRVFHTTAIIAADAPIAQRAPISAVQRSPAASETGSANRSHRLEAAAARRLLAGAPPASAPPHEEDAKGSIGMVSLARDAAAGAQPGAVLVALNVNGGAELFAGSCARMAFAVADAATGADITDLKPLLGASAHLLIAQRVPSGGALALAHEHAITEEMDTRVFSAASEQDCAVEVHETHTAASASFGPRLVAYYRVAQAGEYTVFLQLARQDVQYVARVSFWVSALAAQVKVQPVTDDAPRHVSITAVTQPGGGGASKGVDLMQSSQARHVHVQLLHANLDTFAHVVPAQLDGEYWLRPGALEFAVRGAQPGARPSVTVSAGMHRSRHPR